MKSYVKFLVGDGQKLLPGLDLGPLPKGLQTLALKQLNAIR
jgi:hypothetical protein